MPEAQAAADGGALQERCFLVQQQAVENGGVRLRAVVTVAGAQGGGPGLVRDQKLHRVGGELVADAALICAVHETDGRRGQGLALPPIGVGAEEAAVFV